MLTTIILILLISAFIINGFRKIPVPFNGQVTIWGERSPGNYRKEGWTFLPLYPYFYGVILINMKRITFTVTIEKARTPDRAESRIPIVVTIRPVPEFLINYINNGKEIGVKEQLSGQIEERVRQWCMSDEEGPRDWIELNKSQSEASSILIKKMASDYLTQVPDYAQEVPTWIWMRYFSKPRPKTPLKNEEYWAENDWEKVDDVIKEIEKNQEINGLVLLKENIDSRRKEVEGVSSGGASIIIESLGIAIERLNIGDIDVLGEVATQAEMQAKEEQERQSEETETTSLQARIESYMKPPFNFSAEQALEILQTERSKVAKNINEHKISMSEETIKMFKGISSEVISEVFKKFKTKQGGIKNE